VASGTLLENSDAVVVVDIDESALEAWGQWPWPRSKLAALLETIAGMGASSVALNFIMAEPDRTSHSRLPGWADRQTGGTETHQDNDAILAQTLASGPYVLGYAFTFDVTQRRKADCPITPLDMINIRPVSADSGAFDLFQARDVVCNIPRLARAAPRA
jgi:adenylate cyclase